MSQIPQCQVSVSLPPHSALSLSNTASDKERRFYQNLLLVFLGGGEGPGKDVMSKGDTANGET